MRVLLDIDILRYQIGSIKAAHPFIPNEFIPAPESEICRLTEDLIQHVIKINNADSYECVLSGKGNFRHEVAKQEPYKGNRDPNTQRPYHYDTVGEYVIKNHPTIVVDDIEADDYLGIEQRKDLENTLIATRDKDLLTVAGWHYRWACGENQPERLKHWVEPFEARRFFFEQMLHGDSTDNIIGCGKKIMMKWGGEMKLRRKGVGEKGAIKLLEDCTTVQEMFDVVSLEYEKIFFENYKEVMLENARLLYIGQEADNMFDWDWLDYTLNKESNNGDELLPVGLSELSGNLDGESGIDCEV